MKKLLCILSLLMLGTLTFGQTAVLPCSPNNPTNCTDYFGVANWANSPLPAGTITGFTVKASGSGYSSPTSLVFTMTDVNLTAPVTLSVTAVLNATGGLASVTGTGPAGSIAPQITVTDMGPGWTGAPAPATCGAAPMPACGSGAVVLPTIGSPLTAGTGVRKFVDTLPDLKAAIAVPDTITFPGSDYYVIALKEYSPNLHTDLPQTKLRGYVQLNKGTDANGANTIAPPPQSYLGPVILAQKNRPVRVLFQNMLPIGTGGNLFIPTDTTYMGAGAPYTQNRATLHLHGGATPWISDGTPHQWTAPKGEAGPARGDSVQFVPDMWFDSTTGNLIGTCAGQPTCTAANATNDPGPGNLTFFWTNQQGGRLMFYHDHAYGITRLNVYAGEAAGYLLVDPTEEAALAAANVPGTIVGATPDLAHLIPLVIQDKTFVASANEIAAEDPTWTAGGYGTTSGTAHPGDLWFPHVYTTNQNPADPGGANAFGRWDYGPWTLPGNQTALLAANPQDAVTVPCTSSAFPNQTVQCPITPNPSGTPEGFMDTPLVNGKAYPVLHVAPEAYRFQILSAGNDRSWNLSWYLADPTVTTADGRTNTEVKMVPAVQPTGAVGTTPLCTQITPITNTTLFMGLATALLDSTGNPLNGTGLPGTPTAPCWPNFGAGSQTAGIPVQQTMWAADGRAGGAPDPTTAGPPWIQIGTEGGLLPAPVAIPAMPIGYEANTRSVTITNVSVHGLWLGPAERADAVVDFSQFPGKTLILYNDAPTPAPAVDSRLDYFTGDGDQTPIGGAPNTLAGYGPNTRTIMQVVVDLPTTAQPAFNLGALQAALPGIFAQTQPQIIVPEPTYPPASGGYSPTLTYSLISDATLTWFPIGSTTPVTYTDERKTIQELFTLDYGRMNATLGVELPLTNFLTQTTIPLGYIDPLTEVMMSGPVYPATSVPLKSANDNTQLWHITHNGVDTHFIHFHLFNVQVINRSGWDGTVRPIDQNELGWKDTVRMNPLEDILVALQPIQPVPPFPVVDSYRKLDVTMMVGSDCPAPAAGQASPLPCSIMTDVNPANNNPLNTPNAVVDFGWEYVWHCHILGHEENDMMRAISFNVPPEAPSNLTVAQASGGGLTLSFTDNSASETGFTLQRDVTAAFASPTNLGPIAPLNPDANGQGITYGGTLTYNDTAAGPPGPYFYRVQAFKPLASYWSSGKVPSPWSNTASFGATLTVSPAALNFGTVGVTSPVTVSTPQSVTLSNTGTAAVTYTLSLVPAGQFVVQSDSCGGIAAGGAICTINVEFAPTAGGVQSASLNIATTSLTNPTFTVSLNGTGGTALPLLTITANSTTMKYGSKALPIFTFTYNPANPTGTLTPPTCSAYTALPPVTPLTNSASVGTYPIVCSNAIDASYSITYVAGSLTVTPAPLTIWASNAAMQAGSTVPVIQPLYVGLVNGDTAPLVWTPRGNTAPTCSTTALSTSPVGTYPSSCSGAVDPNYVISYVNGTVTVSIGALTITAPSFTMTYGGPVPTSSSLTPTYSINPPATPFTPPVCTTSVTTLTNAGTYNGAVICSGAADPNYAITYFAGNVTINTKALTINPPTLTTTYGTVPALTPALVGLVAGDTLTTAPTCTTTPPLNTNGTTPVGTYPVTCSGAADLNYIINYGPAGTLTIARKAASVTPNPATQVYGMPDPPFIGTLIGFLAADNVTATYSRTVGKNVGSYTISATLSPAAVLGNYTITSNTAAFTITRAPASVTPNAASKVWGQPDPLLTGTMTGFLPADGVTATYTRTPGTAVGTYTISATLAPAVALNNYAITYNTAVFTILSAIQLSPATLTFAAQTLGTSSANQTVALHNSGGATLSTIAVTLVGLNPGDFQRQGGGGSCGTSLAAGATCNIYVRFRPTATGTRTANLSVTAAGFNSGTVSLTGTAYAAITVSPTNINFGNVTRGTTVTQAVTLSNPAANPVLTGIGIAFTGNSDFSLSTSTPGTCSTSLNAGSRCTIIVQFAPKVTDTRGTTVLGTMTVTGTAVVAQSAATTLSGTPR